jgi:hypothetical protein
MDKAADTTRTINLFDAYRASCFVRDMRPAKSDLPEEKLARVHARIIASLGPDHPSLSVDWIMAQAVQRAEQKAVARQRRVCDARLRRLSADLLATIERFRCRPEDGDVYFLQCADFVKVGFSQNFYSRLAGIRTSNPLPLTLLGVINGSLYLEAAIHNLFLPWSAQLEWYHAHRDVLFAIKAAVRAHGRPVASLPEGVR